MDMSKTLESEGKIYFYKKNRRQNHVTKPKNEIIKDYVYLQGLKEIN